MKQNHELAGIEVLRFICAFGVLMWHYQNFFFIGGFDAVFGEALRPTLPLYWLLSLFYDNGSLAVPIFWVISGFIFYWHYAESVRGGAVKFFDFFVRRFSRLYPLHFVTLILVAMGQYLYYSLHHTTFLYLWNKPIWFASQLLFASNWFARQPPTFNGPIWSVSIEILIYFFFFGLAKTLRPNAWVAATVAALFAICFNTIHGFINPDVFACGMYFFAGGVVQRLARYPVAMPVAGCVGAVTLVVVALRGYALNSASLILLGTSFVVFFAKLGETKFAAPLRAFAFLGNATYSSYLVHFPLQLALVIAVDAIGLKRTIFYSPVALLAYLALVIGLSLLVYHRFEMPAQNWIRSAARFSPRRSAAAE